MTMPDDKAMSEDTFVSGGEVPEHGDVDVPNAKGRVDADDAVDVTADGNISEHGDTTGLQHSNKAELLAEDGSTKEDAKGLSKALDGDEAKLDNSTNAAAEEVTSESDVDDGDTDADGWTDILGTGRIRKRILEAGDGKGRGRPHEGVMVKIDLEVYFEDKLVVPSHELEFACRESEVLQAVDIVVPLMNHGEKAEVVADPDFAYGEDGLPEQGVPPNSAVRFVVHLKDFDDSELKITALSIDEKMNHGKRKKDRGNFWFSRGQYQLAIQCYRKATQLFDQEDLELDVPIDRLLLPQGLQLLLDERLKTLNNLAQSHMKIEAFDSALVALKQVLRVDPNNEKALFRKSKVLLEKLCLEEAIGTLRRVTRLYPGNKLAKAELTRLLARKENNRKAEEKMSKKMLGLDRRGTSKDVRASWCRMSIPAGLLLGSCGVVMGAIFTAYKLKWL